MPEPAPDNVIVVGIAPTRIDEIVEVAASLAQDLGASLVIGHVMINTSLVEYSPASTRDGLSLAPAVDEEMEELSLHIGERVESVVAGRAPWNLRMLGGDPAKALGRLSAELNARLIIVGGVRRGMMHEVEDVISGSITAALTRLQDRPVVVVPARRR
ncbi:Universal stress protein family protein [Paramicrobacterium humi]|uniref:Universal stress protein family protein n=1 Tax=Paramicrobacterium humi TaxID=640635 RepID=A0A1H4LRV8_9MICO|nr:universal stress protein [Microbacterium humi]SEB73354.1 Universal stress protein family protein [Microbacterium humi]